MALTKVTNDLQDALAAAQPTITSVGTLTGLTVTGEITANGGIALGDNDELTLGDSDEFKIKHHASGYTHLQNTVGTLYIDSDSVTFRDDDGSPSNTVISQTGINITGTASVTHATANEYVATFQNSGNNNKLKIGNNSSGYINIQGARVDNGNPYNLSLQSEGGNVGVGVEVVSSWTKLQVAGTAGAQTGAKQALYVTSPSAVAGEGVGIRMSASSGSHEAVGIIGMVNNASGNSGSMTFHTYNGGATIPEVARFDNSGNFLIGKQTDALSTAGAVIRPAGNANLSVSNAACLHVNRLGGQGHMIQLYNSGNSVGNIGSAGGILYVSGPLAGGLKFSNYDSTHASIFPVTTTGGIADNLHDLGYSGARFDDIYATNGTIQPSDRNEKQDIAELSDAEQRVAVACKGLLRKFRWKDSVAEKGDAARIHFGIIAQDLQVAFAAQGLDAGDYAMFISSTWWETQTEVDAVEAVEATEDTEAVEAADAYTRTDMFYTLAEAPTVATERTRLGVRYPELLAFIISAI